MSNPSIKKVFISFSAMLLAMVTAVIVLASLCGLLLRTPVDEELGRNKPFDSEAWKAVKETDKDCARLWMVDDLLANHKLVGMTRLQIDKLLMPPPPTKYFKNFDYVYWLGPERSRFSLDSEWLGLKFKDDIVTEARLLRD